METKTTMIRLLSAFVRWGNRGRMKRKNNNFAGPVKKLAIELMGAVGFLVIVIGCVQSCTHTPPQEEIHLVGSSWDVVVLGRIDASFISQWRPSPHVSYTQVLAGEVPSGKVSGQLAIVELAAQILPEGGIPDYKSQQEEICFLKKIVVPGYEDEDVYKVVDVMEATPKNLAVFLGK